MEDLTISKGWFQDKGDDSTKSGLSIALSAVL